MLGWWLRLGLDAMGGDLMDLARSCHVHHVIGLHLNLVARGQEGIESHDQVRVAFEQLGHTTYHSWSVDTNKKTKINMASLTNTLVIKKIHIPLSSLNRKTDKNQLLIINKEHTKNSIQLHSQRDLVTVLNRIFTIK